MRFILIIGIALVAAAIAFFLARPAVAQSNTCAPKDYLVQQMALMYGESRVFAGLNGSGKMVEIWLNPATGSWTAVIVSPDGTACAVSAGQGGTIFVPIAGDPA